MSVNTNTWKSSPNLLDEIPKSSTSEHLPTLMNKCQDQEEYIKFEYRPSPFLLRWINGYNASVTPINLIKSYQTLIFYAASNCGVIYDWQINEMRLLQGHNNMVSCIAADGAGRWLVTADSGPDNTVIVWDSADFLPKCTIFKPHGKFKLAQIALSIDAKYLLTIAYEKIYTLNYWIWSFGQDTPNASITLDIARGTIKNIYMNPVNTQQFFILNKREIWIGECVTGDQNLDAEAQEYLKEELKYKLRVRTPKLKGCSEFGKLTCLTYVPKSCQVLVSTNSGGILTFGYCINYVENVDASNIDKLRFVKMLKLESVPINVISSADDVIVTGNEHGELKFYDLQLRLLYWCQGFRLNAIKGISFNITERNYTLIDSITIPEGCENCSCNENTNIGFSQAGLMQRLISKKVSTDATAQRRPFLIRNFIVNSQDEGIGFVNVIKGKYTVIHDHRGRFVTSFTVHCEKLLQCVAYDDGLVVLFHFGRNKLVGKVDLPRHLRVRHPPKADSIHSSEEEFVPNICATCVQYSPSGMHLACGLDNGGLLFLHPTTLDIKTPKPFKDTTEAIRKICFSHDSSTLAFADDRRKVCVYCYNCQINEWLFMAKHRAHTKNITSLLFTNTKNDNGFYKLFSIGEDRVMVEYDIGASSDEYLEILSIDRIEQSAIPLEAVEWPAPPTLQSDSAAILLLNDQYKYKIMNSATTATLKTVLGPRYDHPVNKIQLLRRQDGIPDYMVFTAKNLIGIQKLPLDGNPYKHVAMLGHPKEVTGMYFREDIGLLFTSGAGDSCVQTWIVKYRSVDTTTKLSGTELYPYYCLLEGGMEGKLFNDMRDLFYYVQVLCQGTFSPALRRASDYIPINSLPDIMRALGFFPSQYEVENLLVEAKHDVYENGPKTEIGFISFVKLYLNHRPAFGESLDNISTSFSTFSTNKTENGDAAMSKANFVHMLTNFGESFSNELALYLLKILTGHISELRDISTDEYPFLPEVILYKEFLNEILGVDDIEVNVERQSEADSLSKRSSNTGQA